MDIMVKNGSIESNIVTTASAAASEYNAQSSNAPIEMTERDYMELARKLIDETGAAEYFNGTVEYAAEEFFSVLTATLIVYRSAECIADIVPVWWEFHTTTDAGEVANDFSFSTLKTFIF